VSSGANTWLSVSPASGSVSASPSALTVSVNPSGLAAGTYTGTVTVTASGAGSSPQSVKVTLTLTTSSAALALSTRLMQFAAAAGADPLPQTLQVQNTSASALSFTVTASTVSGGDWLAVSPASGSSTAAAPGNVVVQVTSAGLAAGNYTGTLNISANASNSPQAVTVNLAVGAPLPNRNGFVNGASFSQTAVVSPGSIVSLFGSNLAPGTAAAASLPLPTTLAGVQVLVNGIPAPLFYVSPAQINFQMPAGITDTVVQVVIVSGSVQSLPVTVPIVTEDPGIFTIRSDGTGQAAALNADNSANGAGHPAAPGSVVQIFATGLGAVDPPVLPGQAAGSNPVSVTLSKPVVMMNGVGAEVLFSGLAPGFVGLYQVNARVPQSVTGAAVSLQITINGRQSNAASIAVQ
jgi:adhesin/invasin